MPKAVTYESFIWDANKELQNEYLHGLNFVEASQVFFDPNRIVAVDKAHSETEERFFCIGKVAGRIATVRLRKTI